MEFFLHFGVVVYLGRVNGGCLFQKQNSFLALDLQLFASNASCVVRHLCDALAADCSKAGIGLVRIAEGSLLLQILPIVTLCLLVFEQ